MDTVVVAVGVAVLLVVLSKLKSLLVTQPKLNLPPGPWGLPLIGSIHHVFMSSPLLYRAMRDLARKHGPIMMMRLGEVQTLVVSSPEAAQAIMKTHDVTFADRHLNATIGVLTFGGTDLVFGSYGEQWRQLRKITVLELLSVARVQSFQRIREDEVARMMQKLAASATAGAAVDLSKMISVLINDTFVRESIGSRCKYQDEYLDAFHTAILQTSAITLADLFPSSRLMRFLSTAPRKALECRNRITRILDQIVSETMEAMDRGDQTASGAVEGLIAVLLRIQKDASLPIPLTNDTIMALMFDLFGAGSDTSSTTLTWIMAELSRNPAVMARAQAEVREAFKGKTTLTEDDLAGAGEDIRYLRLVIKEALRLHCPVPLLLPRRCREACQVMGYDIPKGTSVLINVWAICRDPKYWEDAEEFKPERFETNDLDYKGTNFEFLPFGSGRRMCPGANLGVANIELALASLLYHFDWKLPKGVKPKDVDLWEGLGVIAKKKESLILHPVTRFAPVSA